MQTLLREIANNIPDQHPWLGDQAVREMRRRLAELPEDSDEMARLILTTQLGRSEVQLGNEAEAIALLEVAYQKVIQLEGSISTGDVVETVFRLGLAYMRLGESENCCQLNTPDSCLLPIQGGGIHDKTTGSTKAIEKFTEVLERTAGEHLRARWLLNIAHMTLGQYPDQVPAEYLIDPEVFASEEPFPKFHNIAGELGVDTFNNAGGVIADDFDGDGDLDILTSTYDSTKEMRLFENNGDGTFSDQTQAAGLEGMLGGLNMVQADYDNDGDLDVYIMRGAWLGEYGRHPNSLLRNEGNGTFVDVTFASGLGEEHYPSQTAAWADYDNDGDVDLYVGNEHMPNYTFIAPCQLFRNEGDGTFTDVSQMAGVENFGFSKGVVWGDYDGDRFPDIYVSNLSGQNRLYHNDGDGTFTDVAASVGVDSPRNSFPTWFWDFDNDGALDLFVPSYLGMPPALGVLAASYLGLPHGVETHKLYRGDGRGGFEEVAEECHLTRLAFPMGCNFGDLDNDGYLDFYLGTGYPDFEGLMPNVMYRNVDGTRFSDVTVAGGFGHLQKGHAVAFADFDQDGDQDVFEQMGGGYAGDSFSDALYENPGFGAHWLSIQLVGERSNRSAIGARIRIDLVDEDGPRTVYKHVNSGGSFGSNPLRQTIGLGQALRVERLEVYWPTTDSTQTFADVEMDRILRIEEDDDDLTDISFEPMRLGSDLPN